MTRDPLSMVEHRAYVQKGSNEGWENQEYQEKDSLGREITTKSQKGKRRLERSTQAGEWLVVLPDVLNGTTLSTDKFWDNICLGYRMILLELNPACDRCGAKLTVDHPPQ